jgi:hypothetical protein
LPHIDRGKLNHPAALVCKIRERESEPCCRCVR